MIPMCHPASLNVFPARQGDAVAKEAGVTKLAHAGRLRIERLSVTAEKRRGGEKLEGLDQSSPSFLNGRRASLIRLMFQARRNITDLLIPQRTPDTHDRHRWPYRAGRVESILPRCIPYRIHRHET